MQRNCDGGVPSSDRIPVQWLLVSSTRGDSCQSGGVERAIPLFPRSPGDSRGLAGLPPQSPLNQLRIDSTSTAVMVHDMRRRV
jgi:hypothetical protein